ncbi:MAG: alanine racemase [Azospirillaceae bacterium]
MTVLGAPASVATSPVPASAVSPTGAAPATDPIPATEPILTVDLSALRRNYGRLADHVAPAACAAVVKADAYGLGAVPVVRALVEAGCRAFFVGTLAEGLEIAPTVPPDGTVYLLNGLVPGTEAAAARTGLVPVLNSAAQAAAWSATAARQGRRLRAALQVDTGIGRAGLTTAEIGAAAAQTAGPGTWHAGLAIELVVSQLACAEEADRLVSNRQLRKLQRLRRHLPGIPLSLANSEGLFASRRFHLDMVRSGGALFGMPPSGAAAFPLEPVVRLEAPIVQIRAIRTGDTVGYGRALIARRPMRIATLAIGFANGLPIAAAGTARAWLGAAAVPFVGSVSMDTSVVDLSAVPAAAARPGETVEILGPGQSVDALAAVTGVLRDDLQIRLGRGNRRVHVEGGGGETERR